MSRSRFEKVSGGRIGWSLVQDLFFPPALQRRLFFVGLGRLLKAGVPLAQALATLEQSSTGRLRKFARMSRAGIESGAGLAESVRAVGFSFPPSAIALLAAGERTGRLPEVLAELAEIEEQGIASFRKLVSGLLYPFMVLVLSCFILPVPKLVLGSGKGYAADVIVSLLWCLVGVAIAWTGVRLFLVVLDRALIAAPSWLERAIFPARTALFFRVLAAGTTAGLSLSESLHLAGRVFSSRSNIELARLAAHGLERGGYLTPFLAPLVKASDVVILATGEQSGTLDAAFSDVSESLLQRAASRRKIIITVVTLLLAVVMLAKVADSIFSSYRSTVQAPMHELEDEIQREMRGIWNEL